ncbi:hypothetical protein M404DRAFT_24416 [Pisolithus tinctorius Marx 270]|uniref:Uncharacterized protein n=1 Tax=Pisolithus tinctorius Marx 270 TaxID=870435 RepID=A0A0C3PEQ2_PISTI|nr:hypothetical protein M404DRAFT_24416 [Pisolithus tinctorius Marx 270]
MMYLPSSSPASYLSPTTSACSQGRFPQSLELLAALAQPRTSATTAMAPKRDASHSKEASPSQRMRITMSSPTTSTSSPNDPTIEQSSPSTPLPTTLSLLLEAVSSDQHSCGEPVPSSTPSTDTLPGLRVSDQMASASSQSNPSSNTQLPPTTIQGTIGAVRPTPDTTSFDPDCISTCPKPLLNTMKRLDISYLEKQALVLLETHFNRYRQKDVNGRWTISKAQYELQAIYLLQDPCLPVPEQEKESGVEIAGLAI